LDERIAEIAALLALYGKASHAAAHESAQRLGARLREMSATHQIATRLFQADATERAELARELRGIEIDVVIADVPYGQRSAWQSAAGAMNAAWRMLDALRHILSTRAVVAIAANKQQKVAHQGYRRVGRLQIGKRRVVFLKPI
jgi:tRNA G10  N-methylase Trm11